VGISGRIARWAQDSPLTPLGALVALALGIFAVLATPREEEPQIDVTMVDVMVPFPGAAVRDVESLVTIPAEQVLAQMAGVEHVHSVSRPGASLVTVQFEVGVPRTEAIVRTRDTLASHRDWVSPELGVGEPVVKPRGIDDVPVVALTLHSTDTSKGAFDLERVAHAIEIELKRVPGTREVRTLGGPGRAVRVLLDPDRMNASGVSAMDVRDALALTGAALPSGTLVRGNREVFVETGDYLESAAAAGALVVRVTPPARRGSSRTRMRPPSRSRSRRSRAPMRWMCRPGCCGACARSRARSSRRTSAMGSRATTAPPPRRNRRAS
jgi:multidrug efflux pump subunit AcrB